MRAKRRHLKPPKLPTELRNAKFAGIEAELDKLRRKLGIPKREWKRIIHRGR